MGVSSGDNDNGSNNPTIFDSPTFDQDLQIHVNEPIGTASIAPSGRDVVLASKNGLYIIDLDSPFSLPRHLRHQTPWTPADVQWSPFACRPYWIVNTSNQRALVWNLDLAGSKTPIQFILHAHYRAITDINFSPFHPDILATCAVDGFVHSWDLRIPARPVMSFSDWYAGATQVKWSRSEPHVVASSHDRNLRIWDDRKGAIPVTTIQAHTTKIYGVDWSRTEPTKLTTCSLDRTIKVWNYADQRKQPERVIKTAYPVWRARYTPFGQGILAMPQRGDEKLHLFNNQQDSPVAVDVQTDSVLSLKGHSGNAKEFLWRCRGDYADDRDFREFQLISWGADNELILHKLREKYYNHVGYAKGMRVDQPMRMTRRGCSYVTYRDVPGPTNVKGISGKTMDWRRNMSARSRRSSLRVKDPWPSNYTSMTRPIKTANKKNNSAVINWMKGVKFGKGSRVARHRIKTSVNSTSTRVAPHIERQTLSNEIIRAGDTFKKVNFDYVSIKERRAQLAISGPWGSNGKMTHIALDIKFPIGYPETKVPEFSFGKTSALSTEKIDRCSRDIKYITEQHVTYGAGCLEAVLSYLTGELTLIQSVNWLSNGADAEVRADQLDDSSDEEDHIADFTGASQSLLNLPADSNLLMAHLSNAKVPPARTCSAIWAADGRLVTFFPPKAEPVSLFDRVQPNANAKDKSDAMLEGLGHFQLVAKDNQTKLPTSLQNSAHNSEDDEDDIYDLESSSSGSSSNSDVFDDFPVFERVMFKRPTRLSGPLRRKVAIRSSSTDSSRITSTEPPKINALPKNRSIITFYNLSNILPVSQALGKDYILFGDSSKVCQHNSQVAVKNGANLIAEIWQLLLMVLDHVVPLTYDSKNMIMAKTALIKIGQKANRYHAYERMLDPYMLGQIKWANHPFGRGWIIDRIFSHFEDLADVQMLAILSCVLSDPTLSKNQEVNSSTSLSNVTKAWPGHAIDYFPSLTIMSAVNREYLTQSSSDQNLDSLQIRLGLKTSSSLGGGKKSNTSGPDSLDITTPQSSSSTPPFNVSRINTARSSAAHSLSVSPDLKSGGPLSATAGFFNRSFQISSSPPPLKSRHSGDENISTSMPSPGTAITWGPITIHGKKSNLRKTHPAPNVKLRDEDDDSSDDNDNQPITPDPSTNITYYNQMKFEDEGAAQLSLLDSVNSPRYVAYRDAYAQILDSWGMSIQATEIRKFTSSTLVTKSDDISTSVDSDVVNVHEYHTDTETAFGKGWTGIELSTYCTNCGSLVDPKVHAGKCKKCIMTTRLVACYICNEPIRGLQIACLQCGHVIHADCSVLALNQSIKSRKEDDDFHEEQSTCAAGCGCLCNVAANQRPEKLGLLK